jgi:arginine utilization protein RocB
VLAARWGLDLQAAINLDAGLNNPDGSEARSIYLGSVGKFLPTAFFVGRPTHASAPFDGINANLLSSEFVRLCEVGDALADPSPTLGEMPPVPVCLQQLDLKGYYDVTTPSAAWCAFNVLTYSATPAELLVRLHTAAAQAMTNAITHMQQRAKRYAQQSGIATQLNCGAAQVFTFEQLTALAQQRSGANWATVADKIAQHATDMTLNALSVSRIITARLVQAAQLQGPAAIVGFAPVYYPVTLLNGSSSATRLRHIVEAEADDLNRAQNAGIRLQYFIPGIADMSFFGTQMGNSHDNAAIMPKLTAGWTARWYMPDPSQALQLPSVNIGPCGRDYHQRTERVYMPYSFGILPELVWRISLALLKN